jgi:flagellar biosynthesis protein FlhB
MADSAQDRDLPATERRLEKAREEGQVARSRDLGHLVALGVGVGLAAFFAPDATVGAGQLLQSGLRFDAALLANPASMLDRMAELGLQMFTLLLPLFAVVVLLSITTTVLSGGWNFTLQPLQPKLSKLSLFSGLARVFSGGQLTDTLKACLLAVVLGTVATLYLKSQWMQHAQLLAMPLPAALSAGADIVLGGLLLMAVVLAAFALVDVPLQRHMLAKRLRMSKEEVRQEYKENEGNPQVKAQRRARMRELANRRMMKAVPSADLVVMNPSHYAVALKYDENTMGAPRVVAKGADLVALRIRDLAREHKVPVLQAPPLARALYAHTELDQEVPARLFAAVAQVLAWVFQLRDSMANSRDGRMQAPMQEPPVPDVPADMDPANPAYELAKAAALASKAAADPISTVPIQSTLAKAQPTQRAAPTERQEPSL